MTDKGKQYLDLIINEPYKIGHVLGFTDLTELHNRWLKSFMFDNEDQTLLAHRGSYKTTSLSLAIALLIVFVAPQRNIMFFRKTDTSTIEIVKQVSKMIQSDLFRAMSLEIYGIEVKLLTNTSSELHTNLNISARGTSHFMGLGIGTAITGKHADLMMTDDIVNIQDRVSKAERERTKMLYQELQNIKNRGGRFINTGTPWHKDDAISEMPNVSKYDCYQTGLIDQEEIVNLRSRMVASLFVANYELKHIADKDAMFTNVEYISNSKRLYGGIGHIDAAYGGKDGTAFTVVKKQPDGAYVMLGKRWDKHVDDCIEEIKALHKVWQVGTVHVETNGDKGYLAKELRNYGIPTSKYHEDMNKFIKISTYLKAAWPDIYWVEETDPEYISEILDYTENADHDDAPDSAASLIRRISKGKWLL
ncbi:hypothetical protein [Erysipelothrix anatis]|uniref:hypothetical protein n=1 Tax=Erysipelothrix anatis TaxID=2683713 RepID=UPI00140E0821|nr:hypothetical protein [Erysipelothrix anatis]